MPSSTSSDGRVWKVFVKVENVGAVPKPQVDKSRFTCFLRRARQSVYVIYVCVCDDGLILYYFSVLVIFLGYFCSKLYRIRTFYNHCI